ncbi:NAD(P)H-dependent oxidoreductase [Roseateles sp.]|uniref:NAD(P)H-dependent oxidoreductase n=1 Tax=Roseateles sp. TaxID=1971397 RepID=UPI003BA69A09
MTYAPKRLLLIQGHPDPAGGHFCHALAQSYADAALAAGHQVRRVEIAQLDFPLLRSQTEWEHGETPQALQQAQQDIAWCQHLMLLFPLWLGDMPALLKGFLEQVARPDFAFQKDGGPNPFGQKKLRGRSARVLVTMGMPALVYRYIFRAHSVKSLERNVLGFVGFGPIHETLIGGMGSISAADRLKHLEKLAELGRKGD